MENFEVRRASLFASLDTAAQEMGQSLRKNRCFNDDERLDIDLAEPAEQHNNRLSGMRGRRSMFLRPSAPINRCLRSRRMPDYQRNPHKWKKYTLADADDSELANRVGALLYFSTYGGAAGKELEEAGEMEEEEEAETVKKIKFNKQKHNLGRELRCQQENPDAQLDNPQLKGSKLVMPEYVIGQKQTAKTKKKSSSSTSKERAAGKLQLTHLQDDEEEEEEDDEK